MEKEDIRKLLKPVIWDYHTDPYEVFEAASGRKERAGYPFISPVVPHSAGDILSKGLR
jgi:hypothetical protein